MPLKILGWGTMVGVAWLAIANMDFWMRPIKARAAQMVRFARSLQAPPPTVRQSSDACVPALHAFLPCRAERRVRPARRCVQASVRAQADLRGPLLAIMCSLRGRRQYVKPRIQSKCDQRVQREEYAV